jgi:hypothetical protein
MNNSEAEEAKIVQITVRDIAEGKEIPLECGRDMVIVVNQNVYEVSE